MYNKYPFTRGARTLATPTSTSLLYTETTFLYFNRLLLGPIFTLENTPKIEVNVFMNCIVILKNMDSSFVTRTFISNYAKRFEYFFLQDISNKTIRHEVMDYFDISTEYQRYEHDIVKMSVPYFLVLVRNVLGFRLVDQTVNNGTVTLSNKQFVFILRTLFENKLIERIKTMGSVEHIDIDIERINTIREKYKKYEPKILNVTNSGNIPPCIQFMIQRVKEEHYLTHPERLALGIYLKSKNYADDYIMEIYKQLSDYKEKVTTYQLSRLDKYKMYGCEKMLNQSMCRRENDKTGRCSAIKNPYNF
jgi:DNA primase large subunit